MDREQVIQSIIYEFGILSDKDKLAVINDYQSQNNYSVYYYNTDDELTELCNDSLTLYFEQLSHSSHYDQDDEYFRLDSNNWIYSLADIDEVADEIDIDALAEFVYENFSDYDTIFEETASEIEEEEEEEE